MDEIAVLIPCYNESKTIKKVIEDYKNILPQATIYVYDNNSTDGTDKLAEEAGAVVRYEYQQGKGNVIRRMFREIDAKCYIMTDGDDIYGVESVIEMVNMVKNKKVDMVIGDRLSSTYFKENKRLFHNFGNKLVRFCVNFIFRSNLQDIFTGMRAFSYRFVKTFPVISKGFEIETELTMHALDKNMYIETVLVNYKDRIEGSVSKLNTYIDGFKVLMTILNFTKIYRPTVFFTCLFILSLFGSIFCYIGTFKFITRTYTLFGFVMFSLLAVCSLICGVVMSAFSYKSKADFEYRLIDIERGLDTEKIMKGKIQE